METPSQIWREMNYFRTTQKELVESIGEDALERVLRARYEKFSGQRLAW